MTGVQTCALPILNMMFVIDGKLVTPDLDGSILPGITRASVIAIARDMGITVEERRISIDEVIETAKSGAMSEAFGTGTAAVVSPVAVSYTHLDVYKRQVHAFVGKYLN